MDGASSKTTPVVSGVPQGSVLGSLLFLVYINCVSSLPLTTGSRLTIYADDIVLFKPIYYPEYYGALQKDIDAITECIRVCHLTLNPAKCKYLIASRKRQSILPPGGLLLGNCMLEQVHSYGYLGVLVTSSLTWKEHIKQICTKARKLAGTLHRKLSTWADTNTLRCLYLTCIRPHLEYVCQLWYPYTQLKASTHWNPYKSLLVEYVWNNGTWIMIVCLNFHFLLLAESILSSPLRII